MFKNLKKQDGMGLVSAELVFLLTCCLCIVTAACGAFGAKLMAEWADLGTAIGSLNQSFSLTGVQVAHPNSTHPTPLASWAGSSNHDFPDFCDESTTCGLIPCVPATPECGAGGGGGPLPP